MSEAAAPAAPTAPASPTPTPGNGAAHGTAQTQAPKPAAPKTPTARANNGQFLPKTGTTGIEPTEPPAGATQAQKEEWRYQQKLKVFGEEEEVNLTREEVTARLQKLRAYEKKHLPELQEVSTKARRLIELAQSDPRAFLRELGTDPAEFSRRELAEAARLGAMTEEEKAFHQLQQENEQLKSKEQQRAEAEAKQAEKVKHEKMVASFKAKVSPVIEHLKGLGVPDDHGTLSVVIDTMKASLEPGLNLADITPQELATEALRRLDSNAERYLSGLDGPGLVKRLGKERVRLVLEASLQDFEKSQTFDRPAQDATEAPPPERKQGEFITEQEMNRRLRGFKNL